MNVYNVTNRRLGIDRQLIAATLEEAIREAQVFWPGSLVTFSHKIAAK